MYQVVILGAWAAAGAVLGSTAPPALAALHATAGTPNFSELVVAALSLVGVALHAWLTLGAVLAVAAGRSRRAGPASRAVRYLVPVWWQRAVVGTLGTLVVAVPLVGPPVGPVADASSTGQPPTETERLVESAPGGDQPPVRLDGLPYPDRPVGGVPSRAPVVVRPGDSLWGIAAARLGRRADTSAIAAAWPAWYRTNQRVIGPDADHILPGTALWPPPHIPSSGGHR